MKKTSQPKVKPSRRSDRTESPRKVPAKLDDSNAYRYEDLPGRPGITYCLNVSSIGEALAVLPKHPISAAGDRGALNCYWDSDGFWRGVFCRRCVTIKDERFGSLVDLARWLQKWFPELGDQNKEARL